MSHNPTTLPPNLAVPTDDGSALHLHWHSLPSIQLPSTRGEPIDISSLHRTVIFLYPRTGIPGQPPSRGYCGEDWDSIPGARGCTPQSCGFRDLARDFAQLDVQILGLATNTTDHQRELQSRMHITYDFLSDASLTLTRSLKLPTFEFPVESGGPTTLLKRMAWYIERPAPHLPARIVKVWYPVFPPNENAPTVLSWLTRRSQVSIAPLDHANPAHQQFLETQLTHHWASTDIYSRRVRFNAAQLDGFIATIDSTPVGAVTLHQSGDELEVITLASDAPGVGSRLLHEAIHEAIRRNCRRVFLTTTNDNLHAVEFYQRQGLELVAIHHRAVDAARAAKPDLPLMALNGLPIRDEWEFELRL